VGAFKSVQAATPAGQKESRHGGQTGRLSEIAFWARLPQQSGFKPYVLEFGAASSKQKRSTESY